MKKKVKLAVRIVVDSNSTDEKLNLLREDAFEVISDNIRRYDYDYKDSKQIEENGVGLYNDILAYIQPRLKSIKHIPNFTDCSGFKVFETKDASYQLLNYKKGSKEDFKIAFHFITDEFVLLETLGNKILISEDIGKYHSESKALKHFNNYFIEMNDNIIIHEHSTIF